MLVDAAKHGDVEIPVFCYEPKLGEPVGACRMCLVEIEGIPKLQTACSTPVRDGMVVYTQTDRVKEAQNAVVEFLLVNHPLDCPVCDKGGECPLQDIAMGWGPGRSRFIDPKRHFQKPIAAVAAGRDRPRALHPLLPLRAVQPGGRRGRAAAAPRARRPHLRRHLRRPALHRAVPRQHHRAVPGRGADLRRRTGSAPGRGTSRTRARSARSARASATSSFTVRDERVERVLARDNHDVDDGWLCDKGRFGYQMIASEERITEPLVRDGGELRAGELGARRSTAAADGACARRASGRPRSSAAGHERGGLPRPAHRARGARLAARRLATARRVDRERSHARCRGPSSAPRCRDIDRAESILVARRRPAARDADPRPADPQGGAPQRRPPGGRLRPPDRAGRRRRGDGALRARAAPAAFLARARRGARARTGSERRARGERGASDAERDRRCVCGPGSTGDRVAASGRRTRAAPVAELLGLAEARRARAARGARGANARGLREVGCLPDAGPGLSPTPAGAATPPRSATALERRAQRRCSWSTPTRSATIPTAPAWDEALAQAGFVVAVSSSRTPRPRHADVVFPAEAYAEKEGTVTHPDGRLQRLRPGVPRPGDVRPIWQVLVELVGACSARRPGSTRRPRPSRRSPQRSRSTPGSPTRRSAARGVRWQERERLARLPGRRRDGSRPRRPRARAAPATGCRGLRLGHLPRPLGGRGHRDEPGAPVPAPSQTLELAPADAERLGVERWRRGDVRSNGTSVRARVAIRERIGPDRDS